MSAQDFLTKNKEKNKIKYADIITADRPPIPQRHTKMTLEDRAKLFSPYSALRGFEEKIAEVRSHH